MKNEEVRNWNVVLGHFFRKGYVHVAKCTWRTWFEHVHIKEGPRDTGKTSAQMPIICRLQKGHNIKCKRLFGLARFALAVFLWFIGQLS